MATVETIKREWSDGGGIRAALAYIVTRLAIRKEEALKIDPETADFDWSYAQTLDPYGVRDEWEMRKMQDIKLTIPVGLTAARIKSLALVSEQAAYEMAVELHSILADYRRLFALRPPCGVYGEFEETDVVETILRTAVDVWPFDEYVCGRESVWLYERFSEVDGDELYERYLRLFDKINGTDYAHLSAC